MNYKEESVSKFKNVDADLLKNKIFQEIAKNENDKIQSEIKQLINTVEENDSKS